MGIPTFEKMASTNSCRVMPYILVNIGSANGWRHQAITWTNVDLSSKVFCGIHLRSISQEVLMN